MYYPEEEGDWEVLYDTWAEREDADFIKELEEKVKELEYEEMEGV